MGRGEDTVTVDTGFMLPNGVLKIFETIFNIVALTLTAIRWACSYRRRYSYEDREACASSHDFILATTIIFFLLTLILFLLFLFRAPVKCGGKRVWTIIDAVHNALAVLFYFVAFIMACVWAGRYDYMIALAVFCVINFICYLLSLVFASLELCGRRVG
ncbi:uncharacterized protein LOC135499008 [Lineus longissimus]|uniref:uncharacterized protein LOC135499008 n=1 Tax=Lineus longissimus TaxID=88925 RepID=UPI002B4D5D5A